MAAGGHRVRIWDLPTRVFHWALVVLVITSYATGKVGGNAMTWHMYSGYCILALILFRIVWGFVGGRASRFSSFVTGPGKVVGYARTLFAREVLHHAGHNPLGGWSVLLMLLSLATQAVTGLFASDDIATEGPLAAKATGSTVALLTKIHHINEKVLMALVALHVAAILFYAFHKRHNLLHAMITGHQHLPEPAPHTPNRTLLAACLLGIAAAFVYWLVRP